MARRRARFGRAATGRRDSGQRLQRHPAAGAGATPEPERRAGTPSARASPCPGQRRSKTQQRERKPIRMADAVPPVSSNSNPYADLAPKTTVTQGAVDKNMFLQLLVA